MKAAKIWKILFLSIGNSIGNSSTSTTCNPIYSEGTILQLQITMEFHRQLIHQHHLQSHLHCGNDPTVANHNGILSTANARNTGDTPFTMRNRSETDPTMIRAWSDHTRDRLAPVAPQRYRSSTFGDALCPEKHTVSCICYLKNAFRARLPSKLHRQLLHQHHLQSHLQWGNDPRVANHNGIPSATHHQHHLQSHLHCGNDPTVGKSQWNSVDRRCTKRRWHPIYNAETDPRPIRPWSETVPTTHETVSHPSHRRGRSSTFGDGLCMEKHRVSCICYLSKTHFVRDFLQNSIGNSSTSTTCNPIYSEGTISLLTLSVTNSFPPLTLSLTNLFLC